MILKLMHRIILIPYLFEFSVAIEITVASIVKVIIIAVEEMNI